MTLVEAIEILGDATAGVEALDDLDLPDAIKLGIEALKRIQATRLVRKTGTVVLLPGETED